MLVKWQKERDILFVRRINTRVWMGIARWHHQASRLTPTRSYQTKSVLSPHSQWLSLSHAVHEHSSTHQGMPLSLQFNFGKILESKGELFMKGEEHQNRQSFRTGQCVEGVREREQVLFRAAFLHVGQSLSLSLARPWQCGCREESTAFGSS